MEDSGEEGQLWGKQEVLL
jgi:hypothetical protein